MSSEYPHDGHRNSKALSTEKLIHSKRRTSCGLFGPDEGTQTLNARINRIRLLYIYSRMGIYVHMSHNPPLLLRLMVVILGFDLI